MLRKFIGAMWNDVQWKEIDKNMGQSKLVSVDKF